MINFRQPFIFLTIIFTLLASCSREQMGDVFSESYNPEFSCGFVQNTYEERVSWKHNLPVVLYIHESVPKEFVPQIESAIKTWELAVGYPLFKMASASLEGPLKPRQDGFNIIYWMDTWEDSKDKEQGRTSIYWMGDQIKEADIRINAKDFTYYTAFSDSSDLAVSTDTNNPQGSSSTTHPKSIHFESLILHELGHVLGLSHTEQGNSVMAPTLAAATERSALAEVDVQSMRCEYPL